MAANKKVIFYTDLVLIPLLVLTLYSGLELHMAGHAGSHDVWHNRAVFHTLSGLVFFIWVCVHVQSHWRWYKGLIKGIGRKKRITLCLTFVFSMTVVTGGLLLFCIDGANSFIGLLHYGMGLIMGVLGIGHVMKRLSILIKGLKK